MSPAIAPIVTGPPSWALDGVCSDPVHPADLWFPATKPDERKAIALCMTCPLRRRCDRYATENGEQFGVWGGKVRGKTGADS